MREFILYSRMGRTDPNWTNLHDAGRLDIVYECIVASLFLSHGIRKNVTFHGILNGPSSPPLHLQIEGEPLHDVRTDIDTWKTILSVEVEAEDEYALLYSWLEALLVKFEVKNMVYSKFKITSLEETPDGFKIKAVIWGEKFNPEKHPQKVAVKAATYHRMEIIKEIEKVSLEFILDI